MSYLRTEGRARVLIVPGLIVCALLLLSLAGSGGAVGRTASEEETRLSELLSSLDGVGACEVSVRYGSDGEVRGIAVLCEGADSVRTRERVITMLSTLYQVGANRITVEKLAK